MSVEKVPPPKGAAAEIAAVCNENKADPWSAIVIGGTGATGRHLVKQLVQCPNVTRVTVVVRKEVPEIKFGITEEAERKKLQQKVVDFDQLNNHKEVFAGHDKAFSTLGTTRKQAGSAEAFYKVDFTYTLETARLCKEGGTKEFALMTGAGANKDSWFLYPRTKGQVEEAIKALQFPRLSIFRPGLLLTEREQPRSLEGVFQAIYPNWMLWENAKATDVADVAKAMVINALRPALPGGGVEEYNTAAIRTLKVGQCKATVADGRGAC